jgi:hypothetical protein
MAATAAGLDAAKKAGGLACLRPSRESVGRREEEIGPPQ